MESHSECRQILREALVELQHIQKRLGVVGLLIEASRRLVDEGKKGAKEEAPKKRSARRR